MVAARDDYSLALDYLRILAQQEFATWWADVESHPEKVHDDELRDAFVLIQAKYGEQAAAAAVDYLVLSRSLDEDLAGLPFPDRADPVGFEQAASSYGWAVRQIHEESSPAEVAVALKKLSGIMDRLVSKPARGTVELNVLRDGTAYARVPEPGACAFCLMLASRGAVYSKETVQTAGGYHDHCRCLGIEVKRDGSDLPRINRDLEELWISSLSESQSDFELALATRSEFASFGDPRNTQVYELPDESARASIIRWQGKDRFYEKVQKAADGLSDDPEALKVLDELDDAARKTPLKQDVLMWRGVRNWNAAFNTDTLSELASYDEEQSRFTAISADRNTAEKEFTTFGKAGALLRIKAKKGTPGIWMPTNGDPTMVSQQEFLVPPGARIKVVSVRDGKMPIIEVELSHEKSSD